MTTIDDYDKALTDLTDRYLRFRGAYRTTKLDDARAPLRWVAMRECLEILDGMEAFEKAFSDISNQYRNSQPDWQAAKRRKKCREDEAMDKGQAHQEETARFKKDILPWAKRIYDEATAVANNYIQASNSSIAADKVQECYLTLVSWRTTIDDWGDTIDKCVDIASQFYGDTQPSPTVPEVRQGKALWESTAASAPTWQEWQRKRYTVGNDAFAGAGSITHSGQGSHWWIDADSSIERTDN